jgi:hypothetical protein
MTHNHKGRENTEKSDQETTPLVPGAQQEQAIYAKTVRNAPPNKEVDRPQKWAKLGLNERATILLQIGILLVAFGSGWIFLNQANIMQGQLTEMNGTSLQTHSLIMANIGQLNNARRLAKAAETANAQAKIAQDDTSRQGKAALDASIATSSRSPISLAWDGRAWLTGTPAPRITVLQPSDCKWGLLQIGT